MTFTFRSKTPKFHHAQHLCYFAIIPLLNSLQNYSTSSCSLWTARCHHLFNTLTHTAKHLNFKVQIQVHVPAPHIWQCVQATPFMLSLTFCPFSVTHTHNASV